MIDGSTPAAAQMPHCFPKDPCIIAAAAFATVVAAWAKAAAAADMARGSQADEATSADPSPIWKPYTVTAPTGRLTAQQ